MKIALNELTSDQVLGINKRAIAMAHQQNANCQQKHQVVRPNDLESCLGSIFYQSSTGYVNAPIER